jgi:sugar lactone lactonase YvrE
MSVEILCDIACELGEGPVFEPETGTLWWFDIVNRKLVSTGLKDGRKKGIVIFRDLPEMASVVARVDDARQLLATETGLYLRNRRTGALTLHAPIEADNAATRSNDGRVHPCGALWIGTMGKKAETGAGAIYWHLRGEVRRLYASISIPNSICFSPSGDAAYFTDSMDNRMMRVACDPATGLPKGEPEIFFDNRGDKGALDGSVCDGDGVVWNARWGAGSLDAYSPQGERIRSIAIGAKQTSCPALVGGGRIAVTSAFQGMDWQRRAGDPRAGFTFLVDAGASDRSEPDAAI